MTDEAWDVLFGSLSIVNPVDAPRCDADNFSDADNFNSSRELQVDRAKQGAIPQGSVICIKEKCYEGQ